MMSTFLKDGKNGVSLRAIELRDAEICAGWLNDQRNRRLLRVWLPCSLEKEKGYIEQTSKQSVPPSDITLVIECNDQPVGVTGLHRIQWDWRCAEIGICIGARKQRHGGVGTAAYKLLLRYAFEEMGLQLIEADVYSSNKPSTAFHHSLGFKEVGRTDPKALVAGKHVSIILFSITEERWRKLRCR
jgi:RimJ/RimL family protein N-acetyltransferase